MEISNINHSEANRFPEKPNPIRAFFSFLKSGLLFVFLLVVIVASFWVSFKLGSRILFPAQQMPVNKIEVAIPETPPVIIALQKVAEENAPEQKQAKVICVNKTPVNKTSRSGVANTRAYYKVIAGVFKDRSNSVRLVNQLKEKGFATYLKQVGSSWLVQTGAFLQKAQAVNLQNMLKTKGFSAALVYEP
ncbi:hypothetical protein A2291_07085 [candidate division WOR-1 bacterium RIFOXYB2_FULL_42_35]|uniref:SPOR domain-containing protein n=1 Tax=candidate division WOR-1 bacterium RIFOXYC2_FULL_41_25 TaxID=1802586 RepID=A0A1F4TKZ5_UNCSA|nr:MAG: hypothetical protein A2247_04425 [candidate division WOR-1 bacterium RIFOXYA2_FULL_41_14]OGC22472.1 MAG: hypothetical protein A2291_07085 [candidate division WOR-1 bacterium RIFOXYB2_FULL_42_35]OGC33210.1 MAG: hypothetical protein A2462_07260 [candidate division WOR-1 bacterium RIFOXYC2_FULL_41_25]